MKPKSYSKSPHKSATPYKKSPNRSFLSFKQSPTKSNQSFISFTDNSEKFFNPKEHLLPETTETDIEVYKELFDLLDTFNSKSLTPFDFHRAFLSQDYKIPKRFIYQIISDFDGDERGVIDFDDFVKMMVMTPCKNDSEKDIRKVFEQIDRNGKEFLNKDDLKEMLHYLNKEAFSDLEEETLNDEEIEEIIKKIDSKGDGKMTWKSFLKFNQDIYKKFI